MDASELKKLAKACREMGVLELKTPDVSIVLSPSAMNVKPTKKAKAKVDELPPEPQPSYEDVLFWSSTAPALREN